MSFAHTVGEFGVVMMLGGNIPGQTRVASIALYDAVEKPDYPTAHIYAVSLLVMSGVLLSAGDLVATTCTLVKRRLLLID